MAYTTIDDPSQYFQLALWSAESSGDVTVTFGGNSDLQLDWLWSKCRNVGHSHALANTSVAPSGNYYYLLADVTDAEDTGTDDLKTITSDGFTAGQDAHFGLSGRTYVGFAWKANGGTVANDTNGDITTSVQASQTAGFSIATYTGNGGSNQTLGHGLGAEPDFVIFKDRDSSSAWRIFVRSLGASKFLNLNTTDAANTSTNVFPSHSSTTIGVEQNDVMNKNSSNHIMYSFRSIQGYSKIGSYTGIGNENGPFVYTGFKPAWLMIKRTEGAGYWVILDNKRNTPNGTGKRLGSNASDAEYGSTNVDILSNGFKVRASNSDSDTNLDGGSYIYMAFAEHPFVSSKGVPVTAR